MFVWYINLARRPDRNTSIRSNLMRQGAPSYAIRRFLATDRDAYDSPDALIDHAVEMGYPEFKACRGYRGIHQFLGYMVSYFRALREISGSGMNVLLMEDDYHLSESYSDICDSFEELPHPVKFAMLGYNNHSEDLKTHLPVFNGTWQIGVPANGNSANIYTPEGAAFVLDQCRQKMDTTPECVIQQISAPGIYSRKLEKIAILSSPAMGKSDVMDGRWV